MRESRLQWYGHVMRKKNEEGVKKCMNMTVHYAEKYMGPRHRYISSLQEMRRARFKSWETYSRAN